MKNAVATKMERGTLGGEEIRMGIHADAVGHITGVLTKMYGNPLLACVREYSTNARDSHIEAGNDGPIEVTLPTMSDPILRIRDWGVGLDAEGIREVYSQYGASTKRETNAQNGMLGIGCKSALAYTEQFTVVAVKGGTITTALVSYDEDGAGKFTLVSEVPTELPDGVEVSIPIQKADVQECRDLAYNFFRFWHEGHVMFMNDPQPEHWKSMPGIWLDEHTLLTAAVDEDLVVMGGVAYPLVDGAARLFENPHRQYNDPRYHAVCYVPIGSVNFAPSREGLMTTKRTNESLDKLREKVAKLRDESVKAQIAAAPTAKEAQELLIEGRKVGFDGKNAYWKGQLVVLALSRPLPDGASQYSEPEDWDVAVALKHSYLHLNTGRYGKKNGDRNRSIDLQKADTIFFVGFDGKAMTNVKRAKLELWWEQNPKSIKTPAPAGYTGTYRAPMPHAVFLDALTPDEKFWLNGRDIYNWSDVDAIVLPKTTTADGSVVRLKGSYDVLIDGDYQEGVPAAKIDQSKPIYWYHGNRWTTGNAREIRSGAVSLQGATLVCLSANRIDKFKRDFPKALNLRDAAEANAKKWAKTQDKEVAKAYWIQQECQVSPIKDIDPRTLNDPDLVKLVKIANVDTKAYSQARAKWANYLGSSRDGNDVRWANSILSKYPLLAYHRHVTGRDIPHLTIYLNAAYAAGRS